MSLFALRDQANAALQAAGFTDYSVKIREAKACQTAGYPAYEVFVKPAGAKRGRHFLTLVYPDWKSLQVA